VRACPRACGHVCGRECARVSKRSSTWPSNASTLQIIELAGEHPRSHTQAEECEVLEKLPSKEIDRAQSAPKKAFTRISFSLPTKALTSASTRMSEHGSLSSIMIELMQVLRGTWQCWLLGCPCPTTCVQRRLRHSRSMPVVWISRLPTDALALATSSLKDLQVQVSSW
jgi:hypothetical protein